MHLLQPKQINDKENQEAALRISRIKTLRDEEAKLRIENANAELAFQRSRAVKLKEWEAEEIAHVEEVRKRKEEIDRLEAEKLAASVPFEILKTSAEEKIASADEFLKSVKKRESDTEELRERLEERLSEVGDKEEDINKREKIIAWEESRIPTRKKEIQDASDNLAKAVMQFNADSEAKRKELSARETALNLKEESLKSFESSLKGKEQILKDEERRLRDEQGVLAKAWKELRSRPPSDS